MNKNLYISLPYITEDINSAKMIVDISGDGIAKYSAYISVNLKYKQFFSSEVSDYVLVCLLLYCMKNKFDLHFEGDLSEDLFYNIKEYLIPAISKNISIYSNIEISCRNLVNIKFNGNHVGTGLSCGVDSFYTILKNMKHSKESNLNIDTLTFFNAGASGMYGGNDARNTYLNRAKKFIDVADELNCDFLMADTNFNEFLMMDHEATHVFRTLSIPLALQKYFNRYYFSSSYQYSDFKFSAFDPSLYDLLNMSVLSTNNLRFTLVGGETTRIGKLLFISDYKIVQKNLNVCISGVDNCNLCTKCWRTMLDLFLIDKLNLFNDCFDLKYFYSNKKKIIKRAVQNKHAVDMFEIYETLKHKHIVSLLNIYFWNIENFIKKVFRHLLNLIRK